MPTAHSLSFALVTFFLEQWPPGLHWAAVLSARDPGGLQGASLAWVISEGRPRTSSRSLPAFTVGHSGAGREGRQMRKRRSRKGHSRSKVMELKGNKPRFPGQCSSLCRPQLPTAVPAAQKPEENQAPLFRLPWPLGPRVSAPRCSGSGSI